MQLSKKKKTTQKLLHLCQVIERSVKCASPQLCQTGYGSYKLRFCVVNFLVDISQCISATHLLHYALFFQTATQQRFLFLRKTGSVISHGIYCTDNFSQGSGTAHVFDLISQHPTAGHITTVVNLWRLLRMGKTFLSCIHLTVLKWNLYQNFLKVLYLGLGFGQGPRNIRSRNGSQCVNIINLGLRLLVH